MVRIFDWVGIFGGFTSHVPRFYSTNDMMIMIMNMNMIKLLMIMIICRDHATWSMKWSYDIPAMIRFYSSHLFIIINDMIIWNDHMNISITGIPYTWDQMFIIWAFARMRRLKREKYVFKCEKYDSFRIIAWNKFFFSSKVDLSRDDGKQEPLKYFG